MSGEPPNPAPTAPQASNHRHRPRHRRKGKSSAAPDSESAHPQSSSSIVPANTSEQVAQSSQRAESSSAPHKRRRPPRHRGPRKHHDFTNPQNTLQTPENSSVTPPQPPPTPNNVPPDANPAEPSTQSQQKPHGHSRRGGRGNRGTNAGQHTRLRPGRKFGGHLTTDTNEGELVTSDGSNESVEHGLRPDAPSFKPGQTVQTALTGPRGGKRRGDPSERQSREIPDKVLAAEDITTRIHREISSGDYECMICYGNVTRRAKIWYCRCCWAVYHLNCAQKWAKQGLAQPSRGPIGADGEPPRVWKCPACNNPNEEAPQFYTCWCEKEIQPDYSKFLPPHSCGQTCGKQRSLPEKCPHNCDLQCHAGPCPPCNAMGPEVPCYCTKEQIRRRCRDTDYEGWSCQEICGELMPCGEHVCEQICHPGLCGNCEVKEILQCYCGNETREIRCCDKGEPVKSRIQDEDGEIDEWEGYFSCGKPCERFFDCGVHHCKKPCHPMELNASHCPLSPDMIKTCPCGKTPIEELTSPRINCEAPIPECDKSCNKQLKCGHPCTKKCHEGECGVCLKNIEVLCRCGKTASKSLCTQGEDVEPPMCIRTCRVALNCGRHECGEKCCSGEQKAQERLSVKKRGRPFSSTPVSPSDDNFEPEHICTRPCGRQLKCGQHFCPMICHRGPCGTCLEASFEELTCNCGRTAIQPPVPCGSKPPTCHYPCTRPTTCKHPRVPHDCHTDEKSCPKCPYLTEKRCLCGRKTVKAVPCFRDAVSCGTICGRTLACGSHTCQKVCHDGPCESPCKQQCRKPKSACGHPCLDVCHAPFQCSEDKSCPQKITLSCACGGIKTDTKCAATKSNPTGNKKELKCNDACRVRRLALALEIDPERSTETYSVNTITAYNRDKKWASQIETRFRNFALSEQKRLQFPVMRKQAREFLHFLAEDYGLESESQDPEPYRSVVIRKPTSFAAPPRKSIAEFIIASAKASSSSAVILDPQTSSSTGSGGLQQLRKSRPALINAFLFHKIRHGLLAAELEKDLSPFLSSESQLRFSFTWQSDESVLLTPKTSSLSPDQIDAEIRNLSLPLKWKVAALGLADDVEMCFVDRDGSIRMREAEKWSLVGTGMAAKRAQPMGSVLGGQRNRFDLTPLPKEKERVKEKKNVEVLESWDMEDIEEDEVKAGEGVVDADKKRETGKVEEGGKEVGSEVLTGGEVSSLDIGEEIQSTTSDAQGSTPQETSPSVQTVDEPGTEATLQP